MPEELPRIILHNLDTTPQASALRDAFPELDFRECNTYEGLPAMLESYRPDVVYTVRFAGSAGFPRDALLGPNGPRWIANGGAGTDHYGHWDTARTTLTNAAGVAADMMAEYIMGAFLHFTLDVSGFQQDKAARVWDTTRKVVPLAGKTLLIIGLGNTGRAVALRAKAFGMKVLGTRARPVAMKDIDEVHGAGDLMDLLPRADFIAISTPLVPATRGLLGEKEIAALKSGVILADVSRGGVLDHRALLKRLQTGQIGGAALDVFETEPLPEESPLWAQDRLIISPHCSSVHADWEAWSFNLFLRNLQNWLDDAPLFNIVDPARGY